jgi:hypothetical protein
LQIVCNLAKGGNAASFILNGKFFRKVAQASRLRAN